MSPPRGTIFLERDSYRRRRIMDGARILPVAGFVLILLPVLWSFNAGANIAAEAVYLFALWTGLIVVAAILSGPLRAGLKREHPPRPAPRPNPEAGAAPAAASGSESLAPPEGSQAAPQPERDG